MRKHTRLLLVCLLVLYGPFFGKVYAASQVQHVVRQGESLWKIARMYNRSVKTLATANGLCGETARTIHPGQMILIPSWNASEGSIECPTWSKIERTTYNHQTANWEAGSRDTLTWEKYPIKIAVESETLVRDRDSRERVPVPPVCGNIQHLREDDGGSFILLYTGRCGIIYSRNSGRSWEKVQILPAEHAEQPHMAMWVITDQPGLWVSDSIANGPHATAVSHDGGLTWEVTQYVESF